MAVEFEAVAGEYVSIMVDKLTAESRAPDSITIMTRPVNDFIPPTTEIIPDILLQKTIKLDDNEVYASTSKYLKAKFDRLKDKAGPERALFNAVVSAAHYGQAEYFEGYDGDLEKWNRILADDVESEPVVSVADLKGAAKCIERAAVSHNILKIYGVESSLETGWLTVTKVDGVTTTEKHALIRVTDQDGNQHIFDPMNPHVIVRADGKRMIRPSTYRIDTDSREPLEMDLKNKQVTQDGLVDIPVAKMTFRFLEPLI